MVSDGIIPKNMFGLVPESFYAAIGRVVMTAALLELRLLDLLTELDQATQDHHAGQPAGDLVRRCHAGRDRYDAQFAEQLTDALTRVTDVLDRRNAVVHSVWPSPRPDAAYGWRPVRKGQRPVAPQQPYVGVQIDLEGLHALVATQVALVGELDRLRQHAPAARRTNLA